MIIVHKLHSFFYLFIYVIFIEVQAVKESVKNEIQSKIG
jgi:hypothetical protein